MTVGQLTFHCFYQRWIPPKNDNNRFWESAFVKCNDLYESTQHHHLAQVSRESGLAGFSGGFSSTSWILLSPSLQESSFPIWLSLAREKLGKGCMLAAARVVLDAGRRRSRRRGRRRRRRKREVVRREEGRMGEPGRRRSRSTTKLTSPILVPPTIISFPRSTQTLSTKR